MLGLDYAGGRPGGQAIAAAGFGFVVRYLSDGGALLPGKLLTRAEYLDLMAHGIAVVANWETTADRMKDGPAAGVVDAQRADGQVRAVGHPGDRPVYFSADWDAAPDDQAVIDDYLRGAGVDLQPNRIARLAGSTRSGMVLGRDHLGPSACVSLGEPILTGTDRANRAFRFRCWSWPDYRL